MERTAAGNVIRLYLGPGGTHNGGGVAKADILGLLEAWVEEGDAPPSAIPVHDIGQKNLETKRSMLACSYPMYTRYNVTGDINDSASYSWTERQDPLAHPSKTY